jgi:hypothetical protein
MMPLTTVEFIGLIVFISSTLILILFLLYLAFFHIEEEVDKEDK